MSSRSGFTIAEVLVTVGIVLVILATVLGFVSDVSRTWKTTATDPFADAQDAFETVAHNLALATLEGYEDYANSGGAFRVAGANFTPDHLARHSDLDFVCGLAAGAGGLLTSSGRTTAGDAVFFLAPTGLTQTFSHEGAERLLNAKGYYVEFGDDGEAPTFVAAGTHSWRWRLKQIVQPSESLQIFSTTTSSAWIQAMLSTGSTVPTLAENVIALIVLPELAASDTATPLSPTFAYDARDTTNRLTLYQLPPRVRLALVAIDPVSAQRLAAQDGSQAPALVAPTLFQQAAQLDTDLATLDTSLTAQKIDHRIFQREILLNASTWSDTPSP